MKLHQQLIKKLSEMKIIVVFALVSLAALANCQGPKSRALAVENYLATVGIKFREECIKESQVDVAVLLKLEKEAELVNDRKLKCYLRCSFMRAKIVDEKGIIDIETAKQAVKATNPEFLARVEKDCRHPKQDDPCEAAFDSASCGLNLLEEFHLH